MCRCLKEKAMSETVTIATPDGSFAAHLARPAVTTSPTIVVAQEIFGINADMRQTCDELASQGFLAICPDLFWRLEPGVELSDKTEWDMRASWMPLASTSSPCDTAP
jgi:carboxymethylenebutenolidase